VSRVQQNIVLLRNDSGRHAQDGRFAAVEPIVTEPTNRRRAGINSPVFWESAGGDPLDRNVFRNLDLQRNEVVRKEVFVGVDQNLERGE
jgi:hypothetical protein